MKYFKNLNWKIFAIGFFAGMLGMILSNGGIKLPKELSFTNDLAAVKEIFVK